MWRPLALLTAIIVGCAPAQGQGPAPGGERPAHARTLVLAHRYEPTNLAPKIQQSNSPAQTTRLFNAALALIDDRGLARPYLAASLPQLDTDTWRVSVDGRMETTYRLRESLIWHDGAPLTAEDFAFAVRVYKDPGLGAFTSTPQDAIDTVLALDPRTLVIQWRSPYAHAGSLVLGALDPLPSHLLQAPFSEYAEGMSSRDTFLGASAWTTDYVGAGPYRLERWEPGVLLEGSAFTAHALGRPKIDRVVVRIFVDENTTLAAVLAGGQLDFTGRNTLRFEHLATLKREWESAGKGTAVIVPSTAVFLYLQQRPEYVGHEALLDLRVRRALAHAIDRGLLNEGLFDGLGLPTETPVPPGAPFYPEVERLATRYPLDVGRSVQLMAEAGFSKDAEGLFVDRQGRRFHIDFAVQSSSEIERMQAILSDSWRRAGFEVRPAVIGAQLFQQLETRHTLPGLGYALFQGERSFRSSEVGTAANRWAGSNRSGWTHPEYDRLYDAWSATMDQTERGRYVAEMMALASEHLPGYALYFLLVINSWVASLEGPTYGRESPGFGQTSQGTTDHWNIQDWSFRGS